MSDNSLIHIKFFGKPIPANNATDLKIKKQKCEEMVKRQKFFQKRSGVFGPINPNSAKFEAIGALFTPSSAGCRAVIQNNGRAPEIKYHHEFEVCIYPSKFMETEGNVYTYNILFLIVN